MIKYLRHNQIDKSRWDDCISRSANRRVYAFSWYLDLVCPGWEALVEGDYVCVFPLTCYRKWGISYLAQPFFTQQLGIFSPKELSEEDVAAFIMAVPAKYRFMEIHLNSMNRYSGAGETTMRVNHELDLAGTYADLAGSYSKNTVRNIRKAAACEMTVDRTTGVDDLIGLFRATFGKKEGKLKDSHYETLRKLMMHCIGNQTGYLLGAGTKEGSLSAGAFFLFDRERVYFLFAASSPDARENGGMFLLIDRFITENAGKSLVLDFEGGNDPALGRFYKSFGALEVPYPALRISRLAKVVEKVLYFSRRLRK